jgi:hypothetical protein
MSRSSRLESGQFLTGVWRTVVHRLGGGQIAFRGREFRVENASERGDIPFICFAGIY